MLGESYGLLWSLVHLGGRVMLNLAGCESNLLRRSDRPTSTRATRERALIPTILTHTPTLRFGHGRQIQTIEGAG
jgi:hypothetical protein